MSQPILNTPTLNNPWLSFINALYVPTTQPVPIQSLTPANVESASQNSLPIQVLQPQEINSQDVHPLLSNLILGTSQSLDSLPSQNNDNLPTIISDQPATTMTVNSNLSNRGTSDIGDPSSRIQRGGITPNRAQDIFSSPGLSFPGPSSAPNLLPPSTIAISPFPSGTVPIFSPNFDTTSTGSSSSNFPTSLGPIILPPSVTDQSVESNFPTFSRPNLSATQANRTPILKIHKGSKRESGPKETISGIMPSVTLSSVTENVSHTSKPTSTEWKPSRVIRIKESETPKPSNSAHNSARKARPYKTENPNIHQSAESKSSISTIPIIFGSVIAAMVLLLVFILLVCKRRQKQRKSNQSFGFSDSGSSFSYTRNINPKADRRVTNWNSVQDSAGVTNPSIYSSNPRDSSGSFYIGENTTYLTSYASNSELASSYAYKSCSAMSESQHDFKSPYQYYNESISFSGESKIQKTLYTDTLFE